MSPKVRIFSRIVVRTSRVLVGGRVLGICVGWTRLAEKRVTLVCYLALTAAEMAGSLVLGFNRVDLDNLF